MSILRIKQAQIALSDGRLDEACDLLADTGTATHRQAQKLIADLVRRLTERGNEHLKASRTSQALADCDRAQKLGGNQNDVAQLRQAICDRLGSQQQVGTLKNAQVRQARQFLENGQLSIGEQLLASCDSDPQAQLLKQHVDGKRLALSDIREKTLQALQRDDLVAAIDLVLQSEPAQRLNGQLADLLCNIRQRAGTTIRRRLQEGRPDLAAQVQRRIGALVDGSLELQDTERMLAMCEQASKWLHQGRPRQALPILEQLRTMLPGAKWINETIKITREAAERLDHLLGSPLGLLQARSSTATRPAHDDADSLLSAPQLHEIHPMNSPTIDPPQVAAVLPGRFVLQIDGVGSYLVLRGRRVSIGPVSHAQQPDIGLIADATGAVALIERAEEDYFIESHQPIQVNDRQVTRKLLVEGDRIGLSPRCRLKFSRPNPASATARLDFSSAKSPNPDIRQAILMDKEILIGSTAAAHVAHAQCTNKIMLTLRNNRLVLRGATATAGGNALGPDSPLPFNQTISCGPLRLVLKEF